jgi:regulator of ribosome biosynthesis
MTTMLSAVDLLPDLYAVSNDHDEYDDLHYDVYNLTASDRHEIQLLPGDKQQQLQELTTRTTQLLVKRIFECEHESSDAGPLAILPTEVSRLPREKRIPDPKPETKWEKFAREKGIQKKKKERMVFDEVSQTYAPRYGYKRLKTGIEDHVIVEVKKGHDPLVDPWEAAEKDKKDKVKTNAKNQQKNIIRALKKSGKSVVSTGQYEPASVPGIPIEMTKGKRGKAGLKTALQLVQHSTASMGMFDDKRQGEPERKISGKKRNFRDNIGSTDSDKV